MRLLKLHLADGRPIFVNPNTVAAIWPVRPSDPKGISDGKPIGTYVQFASDGEDATQVTEECDVVSRMLADGSEILHAQFHQ